MKLHAKRLEDLRQAMAARGIDGFLVPHADENQSEYLPPSAERLAWLTGFKGSAGTAIILKNNAVLFVDGRYTLQAADQVDGDAYEIAQVPEVTPSAWIAANIDPGQRIGFDPWLITAAEAERMRAAAKSAKGELVAVEANPLDEIWADRPPGPRGPVSLHGVEFAGQSAAEKIAELKASLFVRKADATVLSQPDSIAWIFNIRGSDTGHNPVPLAFAIMDAEAAPSLYIDSHKLSNSVRTYLEEHANLHEPAEFAGALEGLAGKAVLLDADTTAAAIGEAVTRSGGSIVKGPDPVALPKARKNATELAGARTAARRDGAAMVRFLAWLDREAPAGTIDELAAAKALTEFRAETARRDGSELLDTSFETISGAGPNGAIVHYRVTPETSRQLETGSLYLVDSGGQYRDGTTDITRTIALGDPTGEMKDRFTRVLKGHIAIATAVFPTGTTGARIDTLARVALWQAGLDFAHGTGHGIGSFLSVHEGPVSISKRGAVPIEAGMILSNEPGYYKTGEYGIRIENLLVVRPAEAVAGGDTEVHRFETITLCPIDTGLVDPALLDASEIAWLNGYHANLEGVFDGLLDADEEAWLTAAIRPLAV